MILSFIMLINENQRIEKEIKAHDSLCDNVTVAFEFLIFVYRSIIC